MGKLEWALHWIARGIPVFPLLPNSKEPAIGDNLNQATLDPARVAAWWQHNPDYNIGGVPRHHVVADMDEKDGRGGIENARQLGFNFDTMIVRTPSGGLHAWYAGPPTANSVQRIARGIDTRGPNGYLAMPGSIIDGRQYELLRDLPIAPVQDFVLDKLRAPAERAYDQTPLVDLDSSSAIALATRYLDTTPGAIAGTQNETTFRVAAYLRDLGLSEHIAAEMLDRYWSIKCSPVIPTEEIEQIVANCYAYAQNPPGIKHPAADFGTDVYVPAPDLPSPDKPQQLALFDDNPFASFGNMIDLADLVPRDWLLTKFMERKAVTTLIAPGGVGKSQLTLTMAAYLARGEEKFFGYENKYAGQPQYSIIWDGEDDENEMSGRLHALCNMMNWDYHTIKPYISLVSGKRQKFKMLTRENGSIVCNEQSKYLIGRMISAALSRRCALLAIGPLNKLHELNENDNIEMARLMENITTLAELSNTAVLLQHHMAKPAFASAGSYAGNAAAGRGAGEIINGSRAAYTLSPPTDEDINRYNLPIERQYRLLKLMNAKLNRALLTDACAWIERAGTTLLNGEEIGAFLPANPLSESEVLRLNMMRTLREEITGLGSGSMPLTDAAEMLIHSDPIYGNLPIATVRMRIENNLRVGKDLPEGGSLDINVVGGKKVITIS